MWVFVIIGSVLGIKPQDHYALVGSEISNLRLRISDWFILYKHECYGSGLNLHRTPGNQLKRYSQDF